MASEKGRESEGKMRENEKEREELKASCPKNFINEEDPFTMSGGFYSQPLIQNTKKTKTKSYYRGTKWEENQNGDKGSQKVKEA